MNRSIFLNSILQRLKKKSSVEHSTASARTLSSKGQRGDVAAQYYRSAGTVVTEKMVFLKSYSRAVAELDAEAGFHGRQNKPAATQGQSLCLFLCPVLETHRPLKPLKCHSRNPSPCELNIGRKARSTDWKTSPSVSAKLRNTPSMAIQVPGLAI